MKFKKPKRLARSFKLVIRDMIMSYPKGTRFTYDKVRRDATALQIEPPKHPNAWGAAMTTASGDGFIRRTGRFLPSDLKQNHSRMLAEWERL